MQAQDDGSPINGPCNVKADNMSMVRNSSVPESQLKKKSNLIAYHYVCERAAACIVIINDEPTGLNVADMLTKTQSGATRKKLAGHVLHY